MTRKLLFWALCLVVGLAVGLGALWPKYQAAANTARSLKARIERLEAAQAAWKNKYKELEDNYARLQSEHQNLKDNYDRLQGEQAQLQAAYQSAIEDYEKAKQELKEANSQLSQTKVQVTKLSGQIEDLHQQLAELEARYKNLAQGIKQSTLRDPTWEELRQFLQADDTEALKYIPNKFDCTGFALALRDRAWRRGFRSAFVEVGFVAGESAGHALTAFETLDKGLVYVDDTGEADGSGEDAIAYVEIGKPCGLISLEG